ncbi:hypothetical protein EYF80_023830 [Liparis tanakae]|uniref:Uncharacterized protein n=1 Tax=Liparis tanakae TaxID=230148 RepID=A0A4Z2HJK4_9TELE|nr:hypothetical protein EYF80_023830 [Liparis tanakae]
METDRRVQRCVVGSGPDAGSHSLPLTITRFFGSTDLFVYRSLTAASFFSLLVRGYFLSAREFDETRCCSSLGVKLVREGMSPIGLIGIFR